MIKFANEIELQQFIIDNREVINKKSFFNFKSNLTSEITLDGYGRVDLIDYTITNNSIHINIYELKNVKSSFTELSQLCRYVSGISIDFKSDFENVTVNGYLVSPEFDCMSDFLALYNNTNSNIKMVQIILNPLTGVDFLEIEKDQKKEASTINFKAVEKAINYKSKLVF